MMMDAGQNRKELCHSLTVSAGAASGGLGKLIETIY